MAENIQKVESEMEALRQAYKTVQEDIGELPPGSGSTQYLPLGTTTRMSVTDLARAPLLVGPSRLKMRRACSSTPAQLFYQRCIS
jgi:hypothetical protein